MIEQSHIDDISKIMKENPDALQKLTNQLKEQKIILVSVFKLFS